jgi:hypothetical protein
MGEQSEKVMKLVLLEQGQTALILHWTKSILGRVGMC